VGRYVPVGVGLTGEQCPFLFIRIVSKILELNQLKDELPMLQKLQINYVFEVFEVRNDFPYCNF
jgi:hypothetical protein